MTSPSDAENSRQAVRAENGFGYGVIGADLHVFQDRAPVYLLTEQRARPENDSSQLRRLTLPLVGGERGT